MKTHFFYYINLVMLCLSINIFAQNKYVKPEVAPLLNESFKFNNFSDQIIVVSIINPNNREEISNLDELAKKYQSSNVVFIAITDDEANDSIVNSLKYQLTHYQYLSEKENERVFNKYQTGVFKIFPLQIVTNQKDEIQYIKKGSTKNIGGKLSRRLDKLLLAKPKQSTLQIVKKRYQKKSQESSWSLLVSDSK